MPASPLSFIYLLIDAFGTPVSSAISWYVFGFSSLIKSDNLGVMLGLASPAIVSAFLIAPIPNYHNVMTLIGNIWRFFTGRKKYYWRGWCVRNGNNRSK